jgi:hypothetical protein
MNYILLSYTSRVVNRKQRVILYSWLFIIRLGEVKIVGYSDYISNNNKRVIDRLFAFALHFNKIPGYRYLQNWYMTAA